MITPLHYPSRKLFWLALLLIPFTSTKAFLPLGELKNDIAVQCALAGIVLYFILQFLSPIKTLKQNSSYKWLYYFLIWTLISVFINYSSISTNYFKYKWGITRAISQTGIFIVFSVFCVSFFKNNINKYDSEVFLKKLTSLVMTVFYITSIYALVEILYGIKGIDQLSSVYESFNTIIFKEKSQSWNFGRISGVTQEPPFLAIYLIFVSPFVFLQLVTKRNLIRYFNLILLFVTIYFAGSRTGFLIIGLQFSSFILFCLFKKQLQIKVLEQLFFGGCIVLLFTLAANPDIFRKTYENVTSISSESKHKSHNVSNITRWGTQKAAIKIFNQNKYFGVGIGQQGYYLPGNYDKEDLENSWELKAYIDNNDNYWPPGYSMITRLLSETGFVGLFFFLGFNIAIIVQIIKTYKKSTSIIPILILIGLIGFNINFLQFDSFRLLGYWFYISWALVWIDQNEK